MGGRRESEAAIGARLGFRIATRQHQNLPKTADTHTDRQTHEQTYKTADKWANRSSASDLGQDCADMQCTQQSTFVFASALVFSLVCLFFQLQWPTAQPPVAI